MTESVVGPWAREKLDRLRKYLHAYTKIMSGRKARRFAGFHYIDAFAGPGVHELRKEKNRSRGNWQLALAEVASHSSEDDDQKQFLAGSPRVALDLQHPFTSYVFLDLSRDRAASLEKLKSEYGNSRRIRVLQQDCTSYLLNQLANPRVDWDQHRAVVFLDPFGMQVGWETIEALAKTKGIEIFLNFPVGMAIQRLMPRRVEKLTRPRRERLNSYLGSPDWFTAVYREERTLFEPEYRKVERSGKALLDWYRARLATIFKHVSDGALICNSQGGHLYYLLLASHNAIGVKIANDILSVGEVI